MQELVTQYCWGEVWNRPGLDRRTRSLLNLAMLTALNRPHELKLHVRGAINNGLTKDEIKEVFLQAAIYCGVPAAIDSFRLANATWSVVSSPWSVARWCAAPGMAENAPLAWLSCHLLARSAGATDN
jgi:alkylhydroperoxidase/carboxymuconolactone decarboxylase family protein YurZ